MAETQIETTAIEIIAAAPGALRSLLGSVPAAALEAPVDNGWSIKDVVTHLLDVQDVAFTDRMRRIVAEDRPFIKVIDPSKRLAERGYASWNFDRALREFERTRSDEVAFLRSLQTADLERVGEHQEAGEVSVADLAHYCAVHDMMHLSQIGQMLQTRLADHIGNMRRYLTEV